MVVCLPLIPVRRTKAFEGVSLTTLGSAYTQNFDTLSNTAGSTTNNLTIPGWFMTESGGGARDNEQYAVDTGGSTTGDTYSYGAAGSTERALGQLRSGTLIPLFGAVFTNNTGATIGSVAIAYNGEEWRLGTAGRTDQMNFEYSLNATDLVTGTWTNVAALNFVTPDTATTGAKNGNAAADRTALSATITGLNIPNGAMFWIRWNDQDASGADDGLAIDDFSLTPQGTVTLPNLTINDVSLNEGNAGTTSFTFTVSLSAPAGPGGVTFDIATADGTATQPSDYTQKSLTSQTIPAGSSTYSFTVLVNGDTTPETNETFFVNVTNVTGATVTDGQGQGTIVNDDAAPNLTINDVSLNEGNAGTTTFTFTVSLSAPAPAGGVTFDIATADGTATSSSGDYTQKSLTSQTIPAGSSTYTFDVLVNGDTAPESNETFFVNVTNITNAIGTDTQGQGTINNDDLSKIHDVQGNGAATPIPGATVTVEGVVTANFQGTNKLQGFFLQEEDADADADPATSEGIFVFCSSCPTAVAEGQRVKATGTVSEFNNMTEITASTNGSVVITDAGNHLAEVTPAVITLPVVGDINSFYETREGMLVTFADTLTVSEYFELARFGQIELYQGVRPRQFTEDFPPSVAGYAAHLDDLARRKVILDDDNNAQEWYLTSSTPPGPADGLQYIYHPRANGGFSVGTQGTDFFRGGDLVNGLTGVLHWSFPGFGADTWRIRPTQAHPVTFTVANPRPATPPAVGGSIKAVGMNLLNYFTTIDTTSSNSTGPCGPSGGQDCRGADSVAELNRQRERASIVVCSLNADIYAFMELENTTPSNTITDLLGAINARCGGAHPYAFVNTGGTLGTDAIRVQLIYRTGIVSPVGSPLVDLDPVHNRPPTAQTFDVVDASNPAFGERFTVVANHFKSKGCPGTGGDADAGDGQGCFNATRVAQANRLLTWINGTVIPAAGDPDILLLGDFNSYAHEDPVTALVAGGFTDLETMLHGTNAYSYLFSGELGHLDYAFASNSLVAKITGADAWHINADEVDVFDYNDEVKDTGESTFEEKPDGSALVPPRVVFQPGTPYRASDHDPVLVGLFPPCDYTPTPTVTPGGPTTFCMPGSVTLTSSSATGNQWNLNGNVIGGATSQQYVANASGSYTVTVTVGSCSKTSDPIVVTANPTPATPTVTPGGPTTFCTGGSVTLTSSSASGNQWYLNGNIINGQMGQQYVANASGNYTVVVTANGCSSAASAPTSVTVNPNPNATITAPTQVCSGSTGNAASVASAGAGASYNWSVTGGTITAGTGTNSITFTAGAAGTLTLQVTVTAQSCSDTKSANVTVAATPPTPTITPSGPVTICPGGSATLMSSSATGNQWYLNGNVIGGATSQSFNATASGSYTVKVTANGCTSAASTPVVVSANDTTPPSITCPAAIMQATDANACTAVVMYAAPMVSDNCSGVGAPSCTPPSGTAFPKGTTTVSCMVSDAAGNPASCSFTVTVKDMQPPAITCPANVIRAAAPACPLPTSAVITYTTPMATDNCPGVTAVCTPASGSVFAVGTTSVTCTATDSSGNTASCAFAVTVFTGCVQDDSNPRNVVFYNHLTGEYRACCDGVVVAASVGTVQVKGCVVTITHNTATTRVLVTANTQSKTGAASVQNPVGVMRCTITDRDLTNNNCACQ
jgi:predicted extracellular nuclease